MTQLPGRQGSGLGQGHSGKPFRGGVLTRVTKKPGQASSELGGCSVLG